MPAVRNKPPEPVRNRVKGPCLLKNPPPETRRQILYVSGFEELPALIRASPVFYQQYLLDRRSLLLYSLDTIPGSVTVDVCAAYQSGWADLEELYSEEEVAQSLKSYQIGRFSTHRPNITATLTQDQSASIVAFHVTVVEPLVQHYIGWTLADFNDTTKTPRLISR